MHREYNRPASWNSTHDTGAHRQRVAPTDSPPTTGLTFTTIAVEAPGSGSNVNVSAPRTVWLGRPPAGLKSEQKIGESTLTNAARVRDSAGKDSVQGASFTEPGAGGYNEVRSVASLDKNVVAFGRAEPGRSYMSTAEANTGLRAINIQDRINIPRGLGSHFPSSWSMEEAFSAPQRSGGIYPMFSGAMTQEALEGKAAGTVHFDVRGVELTPPLPEGTPPGFSDADFHSSSEARQGVAHLASTDPGERKVEVVIQHEEGVTTIPRSSNVAIGAPLPGRLSERLPNISNSPAAPLPAAAPAAAAEHPPIPSRSLRAVAPLTGVAQVVGQILTVAGAESEADKTVALLRDHNEGEFNQATNFLAVTVLGIAAGVADDAFAAAQTASFGAPVITAESWKQENAGPIQHLVGEGYRAILRWGYK